MQLFWEVGWLSNSPLGRGGIDRVKKGVAWWVRDRSAFWCRGGREEGEVDSRSAKKVCQSAIVSYLKLSLKGCGTLSFKFYRKFIKGSVKLDHTSRFNLIGLTLNLQLIKGAYISRRIPKVLDTNQFLSFITVCTRQTNAAFLPLLAKNMEPSKPSSEAFSELMELLEMRLRFSPFNRDSEFQSNAECKSSLWSELQSDEKRDTLVWKCHISTIMCMSMLQFCRFPGCMKQYVIY